MHEDHGDMKHRAPAKKEKKGGGEGEKIER